MGGNAERVCKMKEYVKDRYGYTIYLTDERWQHIIERHSEMVRFRKEMLLTIKVGKRKKDPTDNTRVKYYKYFDNLPRPMNFIVVIVKLQTIILPDGVSEDHFILTAYQISRRGGGRYG